VIFCGLLRDTSHLGRDTERLGEALQEVLLGQRLVVVFEGGFWHSEVGAVPPASPGVGEGRGVRGFVVVVGITPGADETAEACQL
jgi:hypothetical protein